MPLPHRFQQLTAALGCSALARRLCVLAAAAFVLAGGGPAEATTKAIWGPPTLPNGRSAFPTYRDLGVDVLQMQLNWDRVAISRPANPRDPRDPAYEWQELVNQAARGTRRSGIELALMVKGTPGWANGNASQRRVPKRMRDFKDFLAAASARYRRVRRWMIWGEPSSPRNFEPLEVNSPVAPEAYSKLLDAGYGALKKADPRNIVIGGMTFNPGGAVTPVDFLRWMRLPNGRPPRLDEFGHNPFSRRFPRLRNDIYDPGQRDLSDIDTFAKEVHRHYRSFKRFRRRGPKLWLSEFTISSDRVNRAWDFYVSPKRQAEWLTKAFRIADRVPYVSGIGWFNLHDEPASMENGLTTGLMRYEGQRKPSYRAYRRAR